VSGAGLDYEGAIRGSKDNPRIKLTEPERVAHVAAQAGVPLATARVAAFLNALVLGYVDSRIAYEARAVPPPRALDPATDAWADHRNGGDGWEGNEHDELLKRPVGRPPNEPLIYVYDLLAAWWNDLPPPEGQKRRKVWRPEFERIEQQTVAVEGTTGELFLYVAKSLDPLYTAENCNAVTNFIKDRSRSPEGKARRHEKRKRQGRNKPPSA